MVVARRYSVATWWSSSVAKPAGDRREQYLIVELAHLGEPVDEATCVRLAAAELSRHERQERDADDRHRDRS